MRSCLFTVALVASLTVGGAFGAGPALAQSAGQKAKAHFLRAEVLYRQGEFYKALRHYRRAYDLKRLPQLLFNIAQCYRQLRKYKKALFSYKLFLSEMPGARVVSEVRSRIQNLTKALERLKEQEKDMGRYSVVTEPPGARVFVDSYEGQPEVFATPGVVRIRPGTHILIVMKKGYYPINKKIEVAAGDVEVFNFTLKRRPGAKVDDDIKLPRMRPSAREITIKKKTTTDEPDKPSGPTPWHRKWWFGTGIAVSVGLFLGSAVMLSRGLQMKKEFEGKTEPSERDRLRNDIKPTAAISDALWIIGGLVAGATVVGAILAARADKKKKREARRPTILPGCSAQGCGVAVMGRF